MVFHHQILRFFRIYKGCNIGLLLSNNNIHILYTGLLKHRLHGLSRPRRDFINHGPGKCDLLFIADVVYKFRFHKSPVSPFPPYFQHCAAKPGPVLRTVIHRYKSQRLCPRLIPLQKHGSYHRYSPHGSFRTMIDIGLNETVILPIRTAQRIALFRDCKGDHLKAGICKDLF